MSNTTEKSDEVRSLKRALIDHMVTTMVAGMMSGFLFLIWHLYSTLEKRVSETERENAAALLVLKESAISYKVRLDMLDREMARRQETPAAVAAAPAPAPKPEPSFWTAPPARTNNPPSFQQQGQQQQSYAPPMLRQSPVADVEAARDELRKKISDLKPGSKP